MSIERLLSEAREAYERDEEARLRADLRESHEAAPLQSGQDTADDLGLSVTLAHKDILAVVQMIEDERDATEERFAKIERTLQRQAEFRTKAIQDAFRLIQDQNAVIATQNAALDSMRKSLTGLLGQMEALEREVEERL